MKVSTNTPDLLVVEDKPVFFSIGIIVFILAFLVFGAASIAEGDTTTGVLIIILGLTCGGGAFAAFVRRAQAVFHRPEAWVELRHRSLFKSYKVRHRLDEIAYARVQHMTDTSRAVLVIDKGQSAGTHPITKVYSSGSGAEKAAKAINAWLGVER